MSHAPAVDTPNAIGALIFDLDGTLYDLRPVRRYMTRRLLQFAVQHPRKGWRAISGLKAYRRAQEVLRGELPDGNSRTSIGELQILKASQLCGVSATEIRMLVQKWMDTEPLVMVGKCRYPGVIELLTAARTLGVKLAVCSDYPADEKLRALGVLSFFDVVVTAQDAAVNRFKPHPRSLEVAMNRLGAEPKDVVFIGDRPEVDGAAAAAAGIAYLPLQDYHVLKPRCIKMFKNASATPV